MDFNSPSKADTFNHKESPQQILLKNKEILNLEVLFVDAEHTQRRRYHHEDVPHILHDVHSNHISFSQPFDLFYSHSSFSVVPIGARHSFNG